jgi:hypothetical protein
VYLLAALSVYCLCALNTLSTVWGVQGVFGSLPKVFCLLSGLCERFADMLPYLNSNFLPSKNPAINVYHRKPHIQSTMTSAPSPLFTTRALKVSFSLLCSCFNSIESSIRLAPATHSLTSFDSDTCANADQAFPRSVKRVFVTKSTTSVARMAKWATSVHMSMVIPM